MATPREALEAWKAQARELVREALGCALALTNDPTQADARLKDLAGLHRLLNVVGRPQEVTAKPGGEARLVSLNQQAIAHLMPYLKLKAKADATPTPPPVQVTEPGGYPPDTPKIARINEPISRKPPASPPERKRRPDPEKVRARQKQALGRFFAPTEPGTSTGQEPAPDEPPQSWLELPPEGGSPCFVMDRLPLPNFVRKLELSWSNTIGPIPDSEREIVELVASNMRSGITRTWARFSTAPYRLSAGDLDEELSWLLAPLEIPGLPADRATVFVEAQDGQFQRRETPLVPLGKRVWLIFSPEIKGLPLPPEAKVTSGGWLQLPLELKEPPPPPTATFLRALGLDVGDATLDVCWSGACPARYARGRGGVAYPCFWERELPSLRIERGGLPLSVTAVLTNDQGQGTELELPASTGITHVELSGLTPGRYALDVISELIGLRQRLFFAIEPALASLPAARAEASFSQDPEPLPGEGELARDCDLVVDGLPELGLPPCWPVSVRWEAFERRWLGRLSADEQGRITSARLGGLLGSRADREPIADLVVDAGELGRLRLQHEQRIDPDRVRAEVRQFFQERSGVLGNLTNEPSTLLDVVLRPFATELGNHAGPVQPFSDGGCAVVLRSLVRGERGLEPREDRLLAAVPAPGNEEAATKAWRARARELRARDCVVFAGERCWVVRAEQRWVGAPVRWLDWEKEGIVEEMIRALHA